MRNRNILCPFIIFSNLIVVLLVSPFDPLSVSLHGQSESIGGTVGHRPGIRAQNRLHCRITVHINWSQKAAKNMHKQDSLSFEFLLILTVAFMISLSPLTWAVLGRTPACSCRTACRPPSAWPRPRGRWSRSRWRRGGDQGPTLSVSISSIGVLWT